MPKCYVPKMEMCNTPRKTYVYGKTKDEKGKKSYNRMDTRNGDCFECSFETLTANGINHERE